MNAQSGISGKYGEPRVGSPVFLYCSKTPLKAIIGK